jgi:hypothetical protein
MRLAVARVRDLSHVDFGPTAIRISGAGRLAPPNARQFPTSFAR